MKSDSEMNSFSSDDLSFDYIPGPIKKPCFDDLLDYDRPKNYATYGSVSQVPKGVWSSDSSTPCLDSDSGEAGLFKTPKKESSVLKKLKNPIERVKKDGAVLLKTKPNLKPKKNKATVNKKKPIVMKKKKAIVVREKIPDFSEFDNYELIFERTKKPQPFFFSPAGNEQVSLEHHQNDPNENLKSSKNLKVPVHHANQFSSPDIFATSDESSLATFNNFDLAVFPHNNIDSPPLCFQNSSSIVHTSTPHSYEKTHAKPVLSTHDELEKVRLNKTSVCQKNRNFTSRNPLCNIKNCVGNKNVPSKIKVDAIDEPCQRSSAVAHLEKKSNPQKECALNQSLSHSPAENELPVIISIKDSVQQSSPNELMEEFVAETNFPIENTKNVICAELSESLLPIEIDVVQFEVIEEVVQNVEIQEREEISNHEIEKPSLNGSDDLFLNSVANEAYSNGTLEVMQSKKTCNNSLESGSKKCLRVSEENKLETVVPIKDSVWQSSPKELVADLVTATNFPIENTQVICALEESDCLMPIAIDAAQITREEIQSIENQGREEITNHEIETTLSNGSDDLFPNSVACSNVTLEVIESKGMCNKIIDNPGDKILHARVEQRINGENQDDKSVSVFEDSHLQNFRALDIISRSRNQEEELTPYHDAISDSMPFSSVKTSVSSTSEVPLKSIDSASSKTKPDRFGGRLRRKRKAEPENSLETLEFQDKSLKICKVVLEPLNLSKHSSSICSRSVNVTLDKLSFLDQSRYIPENLSTYEEIFDTFIETTSTEKILKICEQSDVVEINSLISRKELMTAKKIGEGSYAEVFKIKCQGEFVVLKIVPVESLSPSGEPQLSLDEALSEIIISKELNGMRNNPQNKAAIFIEVKRISYAQGKFPSKLLKEWTKFANTRGEDAINEDPAKLNDDQRYIIFHYAYGGMDLEHYKFSKGSELTSVIKQLSVGLAAAELACKFEHRDLHEGNILVTKTRNKYVDFILEGRNLRILTNGCNVKVIDFTLSRLDKDDTPIFKDLDDPALFTGTGDTQYDVYRAMKYETKEEWHAYTPITNVLWLSFLMNRLCERHPKILKRDKKSCKMIKTWVKDIEHCDSAKDFVYKSLVNFVEDESWSF